MKKLNLGCGKDVRKGWINLDINQGEGVDIVHDLNQIPLPFENEEFDFILCYDIIEHLDYLPLINELHRILKKGGIIKIRVPHFTSKLNFGDPTHKNLFSIMTFRYFLKERRSSYKKNVFLFSKIYCRINLEKFGKFGLKSIIKSLERWINKSNSHQSLYESSFLRIFPARNMNIILKK